MKAYSRFKWMMVTSFIIISILALASPLLINYWTAQGLAIDGHRIRTLVLVMIGLAVLQIVVTIIREKFAKNFNITNFQSYLGSYYRLNYDFINENGPMTLLERMIMGVNSTYSYLTGDYLLIRSKMVVASVILIILYFQNQSIFWILLGLVPVYYGGFKLLNKELLIKSKELQTITSAAWGDILSIVEQTDYLKQLGNHERINELIVRPLERIYQAQANINIFAQTSSSLLVSITTIVQTLVMAIALVNSINTNQYMDILSVSILVPLFLSSLQAITNSNLDKRDYDVSQEFFKSWLDHFEKSGQEDLYHEVCKQNHRFGE